MQRPLVELSALHDGGQMASLVLEQAEVLKRVPVHHDQVGKRPRRQGAEAPLHPHHPRADRRRRTNDLNR